MEILEIYGIKSWKFWKYMFWKYMGLNNGNSGNICYK
jgi:hypothetical protein